MKFSKIMSFLLILSLSAILLSACSGGKEKLQLTLEPDTGRIKMLSRVIRTRGELISVSADKIPSGAELQVYLYDEAHPNDYIMVIKLNSTKRADNFIISETDRSYKIGAVLFGTDKKLTLDISYSEK